MNCSLPGSSVQGIFQARILEWVAIPSPGALPDPGIKPTSPALQVDSLPLSHQGSYPGVKTYFKFFFFHKFSPLASSQNSSPNSHNNSSESYCLYYINYICYYVFLFNCPWHISLIIYVSIYSHVIQIIFLPLNYHLFSTLELRVSCLMILLGS